jgi:hypothetical protein
MPPELWELSLARSGKHPYIAAQVNAKENVRIDKATS